MTHADFVARLLNRRGRQPTIGRPAKRVPLTKFLRQELGSNLNFDVPSTADRLAHKAQKAGYSTSKNDIRRMLWRIKNESPETIKGLRFPNDDCVKAVRAIWIPQSQKLLRFIQMQITPLALTHLYREAKRIHILASQAGLTKSPGERSVRRSIVRLLVRSTRPKDPLPIRWS